MGRENSKGYVLSVDAMLAILIFVTFLIAMSYSLFQESFGTIGELTASKMMGDALDLLDRENILESLDTNRMESEINKVMPSNIFWKIEIEEFRYQANYFMWQHTYSFGNTGAMLDDKEFVKGRRIFLTFSGNEIDRFYNLEYWLWKVAS